MALCGASRWDKSRAECSPLSERHVMEREEDMMSMMAERPKKKDSKIRIN